MNVHEFLEEILGTMNDRLDFGWSAFWFKSRNIIMPPKWRPVSVSPSFCLSRASTYLENQRSRKPKIGAMEAHHIPWTYLEVKRSKIKVTRPINAVRDNDRREFPRRKVKMSVNWNEMKMSEKSVFHCLFCLIFQLFECFLVSFEFGQNKTNHS